MVIFEDLHWIDERDPGIAQFAGRFDRHCKLLLLVNYRPEYSHQWGSKTYYTQLRLDPLGKESAEEMLTALLGDGEDLLPLKRLIIERTEGNPFFMEEIVQALFEEGVLVAQRGGEAGQAAERDEGSADGAGDSGLAHRPAAGDGEGVAADAGGAGREFPL